MRAVLVAMVLGSVTVLASAQQPIRLEYSKVVVTITMDGRHCYCMSKPGEPSCCPEYSASVDENGTVVYNGLRGAQVQGERVHSIPVSVVRDLVSQFFEIKFFSLQDRYESKKSPDGTVSHIDHAYASTITVDIDGKKKSVYNFYGAPDDLTALQEKLIKALQVSQYTGKK